MNEFLAENEGNIKLSKGSLGKNDVFPMLEAFGRYYEKLRINNKQNIDVRVDTNTL